MMILNIYNRTKSQLITIVLGMLVFTTQSNAEQVAIDSKISNANFCYHIAKLSSLNTEENLRGLKYCNRAIRFDSLGKTALAKTYINRGVLLKNLQRTEYAKGDYLRARKLLGDTAALRVNIGNTKYIEKDYHKAIAEYNKALAMQLERPYIAYLNRGLAHERLGNYQDAINDYLQALTDNPRLDAARNQLINITYPQELLSDIQHKQPQKTSETIYPTS